MEPNELKEAIELRGMTQLAFARALCVSPAAISLWVNGERPIPGWLAVAIRAIPARRKKSRKLTAGAVVLFLLLAPLTRAGDRPGQPELMGPPAPKEYRAAWKMEGHKADWRAPAAIYGIGAGWDVLTSAQAWRRGGIEVHPWMIGEEGNVARLVLIDAAASAVLTGFDMVLQKWAPNLRWIVRGLYAFWVGRVGIGNLTAGPMGGGR